LFDLDDLQARVAWYDGKNLRRLELLKLESGAVRAEGAWLDQGSSTRGVVFVETPVTDFGVAIDRGETDITLNPSRLQFSATGFQ
jgi:hypothetical protein